jgi:hypothetical protein
MLVKGLDVENKNIGEKQGVWLYKPSYSSGGDGIEIVKDF